MPSYPRAAAVAAGVACLVALTVPAGSAQDGGPSDQIRRRLAQWQSDPVLTPFTLAGPGLPAPGAARTKIAICFGVNEVDPAYYGGPNRLGACESDARSMEALARQLGFETTIRLTREATSRNLFAHLRDAATRLQPGDVLIVTYAGHGSTVRDENGDERPNTEDQTWCLYDRMVIDDELGEEWTRFRAGVRIYVVADSCHSGTSTRALARGRNPGTRSPGALTLTQRDASSDFKVRTLFPEDQKRAEELHLPAFGGAWRALPGFARSAERMQASGLLLAGCDDHETSGESGGHGLFTNALLQTVADGQFTGTYRELIERASQKVGARDANQHPKLFQFGAIAEDIATARPFAH
ncbi:caspase family protein [bacterium]|nr:caspase family protein [bacterium]